jgi:long-chain acyl-CoA synthetase
MNLNQDIENAAQEHSSRTALVWNDAAGDEQALNYGQFFEKVLRSAAGFRARGIGKGDTVAIIHRNDPAFIIAYFGLTRIGAIAVPINFMISKPEELEFLLAHSNVKGVVTQRPFLPGVLAVKKQLSTLKHVWVTDAKGAGDIDSFHEFIEKYPAECPAAETSQDDTLMVLYTSGTTGQPKGVELTHKNLSTNCEATSKAMGFTHEDTWLALLPMFHTFCWTACVLIPLRIGAKVVIATNVAPPEPWLGQIKKHGITVFASVPQIYALLCNEAAGYLQAVQKGGFLKSVRLCISGAAPLSQAIHDAVQKGFGLEITEGFGLTETSPVATLNPRGGARVGSVGRTIPGVDVKVIAEDGSDCEIGDEGEIMIKGPNVMKGYLKNVEATTAAIDSAGWFRSGDIGTLDDEGYLYICDRKKDMIIVKGLKVFPAQLEKKFFSHPAVADVAVIGLPDETGDESIKAYVVIKSGAQAGPEEFLTFCRANFDAYKRPKFIELVSELPKNATGKTLKRVLRDNEMAKRRQPAAA